jgi:hypothetical protein
MLAQETKNELVSAHKKLRSAIDRVTENISVDTRLLHSVEFDQHNKEIVVEKHLIKGVWINLFNGVKMMLIDDSNNWTRALCQSTGISPKHYHTYYEKILVIDGEVIEHTTNQIFLPGSEILHEPNVPHQPEINGLVMMMWKPPLPQIRGQSIIDPVIYHIMS